MDAMDSYHADAADSTQAASVYLTQDRPPIARALTAGFILLGITILALPLRFLPPYPATMVLGMIGTISVFGVVYYKYQGRLALNPETAFMTVMALQYLLAPAISRVMSDNFDVSQTAERTAVKDGYAGAMLIVMLFSSVFLITGAFLSRRAPIRVLGGPIWMSFSRRTYLVVIYGAIGLWMTRMALLASGSFYHLNRSRFQFEDPRYSAWAQYDAGIGPVIVAFAWASTLTGKLRKSLAIAYTVLDLGWNFASGGRERTVIVMLTVLVTVIVYRNRLPWKWIVVLSVPGLLLLGFMDYYRYAIRETESANSLSLNGIITAVNRAQAATEKAGIRNTIVRGVTRVNDLDSVSAMYLWVPDLLPYQHGETYGRIPQALVPRAFWPDKPPVMIPINEFFFQHEGGTSPTTTMGEGWLNFGVAGVILAAMLSAILLLTIQALLTRLLWNAAMLPVYIGSIAILSRMHTQPIAVWITTILKVVFLAVVVHWLTRPRHVPDPAPVPYLPEYF